MSNRKGLSTREGLRTISPFPVRRTVVLSPYELKARQAQLAVAGVLNPGFFRLQDRLFLLARVDEVIAPACCEEIVRQSGCDNVVPYTDLGSGEVRALAVNFPKDYDSDHDRLIVHESVSDADRLNEEGIYLTYASHLRLLEVDRTLKVIRDCVLRAPSSEFDKYGCEDARATIFGSTIEVTYNGISRFGSTAMRLPIQSSLLRAEAGGHPILGPDQKHPCIFGRPSENIYFLLCRPLVRTMINADGVWLFTSTDLQSWKVIEPLLLPRLEAWDSVRVGPGTPPIDTDSGWLMFYYGVDHDRSYHIGAALLDRENPRNVLARSSRPIISPTYDWELHGRRADTVFPCGVDIVGNDVTVYYGAADTHIAAGAMRLDDVLGHLATS
jgi:predicted GH43/DUF377 family glycosyl hydrolase